MKPGEHRPGAMPSRSRRRRRKRAVRPRRARPGRGGDASPAARPQPAAGGGGQRCAPVPIAPGRPAGSPPARRSQVLRPGSGLSPGPPPGAAGKRLPVRAAPLARPPHPPAPSSCAATEQPAAGEEASSERLPGAAAVLTAYSLSVSWLSWALSMDQK